MTPKAKIPELRFPGFEGEWEVGTVSKIADVIDCKHRTPPYVENGIPVISPGTIKWGEVDLISPKKRVSEMEFQSLMDHCVPKRGDLIFSRNQSIGVACYILNEEKFVLGQDTVLIQASKSKPFFLYYRLQTPIVQSNINVLSGGSTFSRINLKDIRELKINISPTLAEQEKIANFLSDVDQKIEKLSRKRDLLREYKKGMMQKLFSQELRFKDENGEDFPDWEEKRLGEVVLAHSAGIYKKKDLYGEGYNIIGVSNIYNIDSVDGQIFNYVPLSDEEYREFRLEAGDLIYGESSLVREGIAKTVYVTKNGEGTVFAWHTRRYKVDRNAISPPYLYYFMNTRIARTQILSVATQTALTGITTTDYFRTMINFPTLREQAKIAEFLGNLDRYIETLERELVAMKEFKRGLLQGMFV